MTINNKIKKRIRTMQLMQGKVIDEIQITKEEAEQLKNIEFIDGVRLIVVEKLGDITNKDCYAYQEDKCYALNELYCKKKKCRFYRNDVNINDIEKSIELYCLKK